jgi:hypothetical protein
MTTDDAGSAPEADADSTRLPPVTTEPAPPPSTFWPTLRRRGSAARAGYRGWRRTRPFWGGLLLVLSGLELLALPLTGVLVKGQIKLVIYIGIGGVFGVLIGILLVVAGIAVWVNPVHRVFYGIAGIVLGIVSFPASNLGGFVLGMLLAIIGGALAFAWVPAEPAPVDADVTGRGHDDAPDDRPGGDDDAEPSAGLDLISGPPAEPAAPWEGTATIAEGTATVADEAARDSGGRHRVADTAPRLLAVAAMPAVLVAGMLGTTGAAHAATTQSDGGCILGIVCMPSSSPSPSPTPSATTAAPTPSATPTVSSSSSAPSAPASGAPSATPTAGQSGSAAPSGTPSSSASASPSATPTSTSTSAKGKSKAKKAAEKFAASPSSITAPAAASVLTAGSATLSDFQYLGNVCIPVSGSADCQEMMEFTASSADLSGDVTVSVTEGEQTTSTSSPSLAFSDGMTLYATKLCGKLVGVPLCFTPTTVSSVLLSIANLVTAALPITLTDVTTDQPLATAGALQTGSLTIGF